MRCFVSWKNRGFFVEISEGVNLMWIGSSTSKKGISLEVQEMKMKWEIFVASLFISNVTQRYDNEGLPGGGACSLVP